MRSTRLSEKMDNVKSNDQQWYEVVTNPLTCGRPGRSACPCRGTRNQSFYNSCLVFGSTEAFSVQGDIGTGNVMLKPRELEKPGAR